MLTKLLPVLSKHVQTLSDAGTTKGHEMIICGFLKSQDGFGPRVLLKGHSGRAFLRMNSNAYLVLERKSRFFKKKSPPIQKNIIKSYPIEIIAFL